MSNYFLQLHIFLYYGILFLLFIMLLNFNLVRCNFLNCSGKLLSDEICLPKTYHKSMIPLKPTLVNISLVIPNENGIRNVDDNKMTITIDLNIIQYWADNRILTNFTRDQKKEGRVPISSDQIQYIWKPDLYVYNTSNFKLLSAIDPLDGLAILTKFYWDVNKKGNILDSTFIEYYIEAEVTIYCSFNLHLYPIDEQECELKIGSSNHGSAIAFQLVETLWRDIYGVGYYHSKDFYVETIFQESKNTYLGNIYFSEMREVGFKIKLKRCLLSYVFRYYLPCGTIVIISQISFLIPPDQIPGRTTLLITTFLILANIFIGQQAESPSTNQLSALSVYLLTCLFFVGCAILEFAYLLHRRRSNEDRIDYKKINRFPEKIHTLEEAKSKRAPTDKEDVMDVGNNSDAKGYKRHQFRIESNVIKFNRCNLDIDILSQLIFFFAFILFNICYWIYYLYLMVPQ